MLPDVNQLFRSQRFMEMAGIIEIVGRDRTFQDWRPTDFLSATD
jgi:hypothetical protein